MPASPGNQSYQSFQAMKFSIVTPSYNQAAFLEYTIRSVLGQGYTDLEYMIVDGDSTDGSVDIIRKYSDHLAWWVSEPDKGQAEAINKGFRRSTGEVVAWINSDDMYAPGVFEEVRFVFETHPEAGLVYGKAASFDEQGIPLNDLGIGDWSLKDLASFHILCQPAVFMRKSVLDQVGYLDEAYHLMLDHHLWLRIGQRTEILHMPRIWAFARHHAAAKNVSQAAKFGQEAFRILAWMRTQPDLAAFIAADYRTVTARIHRFNARYLLDGGMGWAALRAYLRAFAIQPKTALQEWHRIVFALLTMLGLGKSGELYYQVKRGQVPESIRRLGIENVHDIFPAISP